MTRREKTGLALAVLLVGVVVALVPTNPVSRERMKRPSPVEWSRVVDDPSVRQTLAWQGFIAHVSGKEGSWIERNLEERFRLELNPVFLDWFGFSRRRPLMLCGGDVPDVMWDGDPAGVRANLRNGFIMEVPYEVILKYAPTYVKYLNRYGKEAWLYAHYEGKNYGLPTFFTYATPARIGCWRLDWLRRVGIDRAPETVEEMHEALRRFRYNDPDGNGRMDTYGWCPDISHWSLVFAEIFAAYDVLAFDFMLQDGRVVWGGMLPGSKETLRVLRTWYEEGLLDPDFVLAAGQPKFVNGRVGYTYPVDSFQDYDPNRPTSMAGRLRTFCPDGEMAPGPPLRNRAGERRGRSWGGAGHILQFGIQLEQHPEKVVRVLRMMEACATNEVLYFESQRGRRGLHWDDSTTRGIFALPPFDADEPLQGAELLPRTVFFFPSALDAVYDRRFETEEERQWKETYQNPAWAMANVLGKSDVVPSAGRHYHDLIAYQKTVFVEIVVGKRPLEDFETFVTEWRRRGGDVLTSEANAMYATMRDVWRRVGAEE